MQQQVQLQLQEQAAAASAAKLTSASSTGSSHTTTTTTVTNNKVPKSTTATISSTVAQVSKPSGKTAVSANHVTSSGSAVTGLRTTKAANTKATKGTAKSKGKGKSGVGQKGGKLVSSTSTVMTSAAAPSSQVAKSQFVVKNEPGGGGVKLMKEETPASPAQQKSPSRFDAVTSSVASPAVAASSSSLSTDELVRLQQKQIEELKSQLADTQQQLSHADKQAQLHQEQLRKLAIAKIATLSQQNALNALLAEQARTQKQIQALAQAHNAQLSQLTQQSLRSLVCRATNQRPATTAAATRRPRPSSWRQTITCWRRPAAAQVATT